MAEIQKQLELEAKQDAEAQELAKKQADAKRLADEQAAQKLVEEEKAKRKAAEDAEKLRKKEFKLKEEADKATEELRLSQLKD